MNILRDLPKIDKLVANEAFAGLNKPLITEIARKNIDSLRKKIIQKNITTIDEKGIIFEILKEYHEKIQSSLTPLINATGIVLHTNLGRSPLHVDIFDKVKNIACGYSNLEYDLDLGQRGERYEHVTHQLSTLLGVEDALIVNNNAAAVFLVLNTFGKGKKTIVSRGELVEIGGSFRIPDVMKESGSKLVEVGTTNKTKISDYKKAISKKTSILMKVHKSNFTIKGFSESTPYEKIIKLAQKNGLLDYFDIGGAYIDNLPLHVRDDELSLEKILKLNPSLLSFSGDKLLGSVQAGVIVGKKPLIQKLKQNQLLRMLRVDKITLGLLEATIIAYLEGKKDLIPTLSLLKRDQRELKNLSLHVSQNLPKDSYEIVETTSYIGGGTMPEESIPSIALHIKGDAKKLQTLFRKHKIIGRIEKDRFLLDFRSILPRNITPLIRILKSIFCTTS